MDRLKIPVLLTVWLGLVSGCSDSSSTSPTADSESAVSAYTVHGQIVQMPDPSDPATEFRVKHEAIGDFKNAAGDVVGMDAMTMAFPVGDDASIEGMLVGDKIEMVFEVDWTAMPPMRVTSITRLPADTELILAGDDHAGHASDHTASEHAPPTDAGAESNPHPHSP